MQGKRHQQSLAKRAAREASEKAVNPAPQTRVTVKRTVKIGKPGYRITKQFDPDLRQRSLLFQACVHLLYLLDCALVDYCALCGCLLGFLGWWQCTRPLYSVPCSAFPPQFPCLQWGHSVHVPAGAQSSGTQGPQDNYLFLQATSLSTLPLPNNNQISSHAASCVDCQSESLVQHPSAMLQTAQTTNRVECQAESRRAECANQNVQIV